MARSHRTARRRQKRSAGVLLVSGRRVLLLRRSPGSKNAGLWGLPGGQLEGDETPWRAARREAVEEIGTLPSAEVVGELRVVRAKGAKRYDVFVCRASPSTRRRWVPDLDGREHDDYVWAPLEWCLLRQERLHPVVRELFADAGALRALCQAIERRPRLERSAGDRVRVKQSRRRALAA